MLLTYLTGIYGFFFLFPVRIIVVKPTIVNTVIADIKKKNKCQYSEFVIFTTNLKQTNRNKKKKNQNMFVNISV